MANEETLADVITSIPDLLMKAATLKGQSDIKDTQMQTQEMNNKQKALEMEVYRKERGMDAAGFGNLEATDYFEKLAYSPATLKLQNGELTYQGKDAFPTLQEAKKKYKDIVTKGGKQMTDSDSRMFHQQWNEIVGIRNRMLKSELQTWNQQGYDKEDLQSVIANNPILEQSIYNLKGYTDEESSLFYSKFLPKKSVDFFDRVSDSPMSTLGIGVGTAIAAEGGYKYLTGADPEAMKGLGQEVKDAKAQLESIKNQKRYKGKVGDIRAAKDLLKEAQGKFDKAKIENTRWRKFSKSNIGKGMKGVGTLKGFAPMIAAYGGEKVGGFIGGDKGAAIGKGTAAGAVGVSLSKYVLKRLAQAAPSIAGKVGLAAMADGPVLPWGDVVGAAMGAGMSIVEVVSAYNDWNKANK